MDLSADLSAKTVSPPPESATPGGGLRRGNRSRWVWWGLVALLCCAPWGGYRGWRWYQTRWFREQCLSARETQDWHAERNFAKRWTGWDPAAGRAWWYAAEAAQELDDLEDMAFCLGNVPPSDPKVLFAQIEKANLEWTALNRPLQALETSQRVIARDPRITEIQSRLISFYAMNLQRASMLNAIRAAIDAGAEPKESYAYLILADLLSFSNGTSLNSRWLTAAPDEPRFKIGLAVHTSMGFAQNVDTTGTADAAEIDRQAMQQIQWFLDQNSHDPVLLTFMMYRAYQAGDVNRVGELLKQVDETIVDDHMIWVYRCWYHVAFDDFQEAEAAVREALRLHPLSPLAHHEYAKLLRKLLRPETEVEARQKLAAAGRELRTRLLALSSALDATPEIVELIALYAEECDDQQVAAALRNRLEAPARHAPTGVPSR